MKIYKNLYFILLISFVFFTVKFIKNKNFILIAHAMGGINGFRYTNTIEAFEENKNYFNHFEVDLTKLKDNKIICFHDRNSLSKLFQLEIKDININNKESLDNIAVANNFNFCDLKKIFSLSENNPNKKFIIDYKSSENVHNFYEKLADNFPSSKKTIIPQVYLNNEFQAIKDLGYQEVYFTFYRTPKGKKNELIKNVLAKDYAAIILSKRELFSYIGIRSIFSKKKIYIHTINSKPLAYILKIIGIDGIYTDFLKKV